MLFKWHIMNNFFLLFVDENEKLPILDVQKPVSLKPSWEDQSIPNNELNFNGKNFVSNIRIMKKNKCVRNMFKLNVNLIFICLKQIFIQKHIF